MQLPGNGVADWSGKDRFIFMTASAVLLVCILNGRHLVGGDADLNHPAIGIQTTGGGGFESKLVTTGKPRSGPVGNGTGLRIEVFECPVPGQPKQGVV